MHIMIIRWRQNVCLSQKKCFHLFANHSIRNTFDCKKLIPNLRNKSKYVTHYRNLEIVRLSWIASDKIIAVLSFHQEAWLKPYIEFNTRKRQQAKTVFEQSLCKMTNNSVSERRWKMSDCGR
jgi:hypothetical protein